MWFRLLVVHQKSEPDGRCEGGDAAVGVGALEVEDEDQLGKEADVDDVAAHHEQLVHALSRATGVQSSKEFIFCVGKFSLIDWQQF